MFIIHTSARGKLSAPSSLKQWLLEDLYLLPIVQTMLCEIQVHATDLYRWGYFSAPLASHAAYLSVCCVQIYLVSSPLSCLVAFSVPPSELEVSWNYKRQQHVGLGLVLDFQARSNSLRRWN